jgi:hypothetical protein
MVAVGINGAAGADHPFPPSAWLGFSGLDTGDVRIPRERMTDENGVIGAKRRSAFFVLNLNLRKNSARLKLISALGQLQFEFLRLDYTY